MKNAHIVAIAFLAGLVAGAALPAHAHAEGVDQSLKASNEANQAGIDLSRPFICKDVSPAPMRITEKGLIMGGVIFPLADANAASTPVLTNTIFKSKDGLSEIDVVQYADDGKISVSYMKFRVDPSTLGSYEEIDKAKIFEKASGEAVNPQPFNFSKNQGCQQQ